MALNLVHQTQAEFASRFWSRVRDAQNSNKVEFHRLMYRLWLFVDSGDLTHAQVRASFNSFFGKALTAAQWTTLWNSKVVPAKDRHLAMLAEGAIDG